MPASWKDSLLEYAPYGLPLIGWTLTLAWPETWPFLVVAVVVAASPLVIRSLRGALDRTLNTELFLAAAGLTYLALGQWMEAVIVISLAGCATALDRLQDQRLAARLARLTSLQPTHATRERGGQSELMGADQLSIGDIVIVPQGQAVPVDGVIVHGTAFLDQSMFGMDERATEKLVGDLVMGGAVVKAGRIKVRVTRTAPHSALSRILHFAEQAPLKPASHVIASERLSGLLAAILGLAGLASWWLLSSPELMAACFLLAGFGEMATATNRLLQRTTYDAIALGFVPTGHRSLVSVAAHRGLVIEKAAILTHEDWQVGRLEHDPEISDAFVWECVAVAEKYSDHPVGRALFRRAIKQVGAMKDPDEFAEYQGRGVRASLAGHEVMIGTAELLRTRNISFESPWMIGSTTPMDATGTDVFIALDGLCLGRIRLQPTPRSVIRETLERLRELHIRKQVLVTNDTVRVAGAFAQAIGIEEYLPTASPDDLWHEIGRLAPIGKVALLGHGQTPTQTLRRADPGIVMSQGGQGLHVEAAGLIALGDDLRHLPSLILLCRRTLRTWRGLAALWFSGHLVGLLAIVLGIRHGWIMALIGFCLLKVPLALPWESFRSPSGGQNTRLARK